MAAEPVLELPAWSRRGRRVVAGIALARCISHSRCHRITAGSRCMAVDSGIASAARPAPGWCGGRAALDRRAGRARRGAGAGGGVIVRWCGGFRLYRRYDLRIPGDLPPHRCGGERRLRGQRGREHDGQPRLRSAGPPMVPGNAAVRRRRGGTGRAGAAGVDSGYGRQFDDVDLAVFVGVAYRVRCVLPRGGHHRSTART